MFVFFNFHTFFFIHFAKHNVDYSGEIPFGKQLPSMKKYDILQKAGNSPVISPNLLPACLSYLSNFSAAASKNFTLDQAVPPCANGSIVLTKT